MKKFFQNNQLSILVIVSILLYSNTFTHEFVLDDEAVITKNEFVKKGIDGIQNIFTGFYWQGYWSSNSGIYRPLSLVVFAIEWQLFGNNALIFHCIHVLIYALVVAVLFIWLHNKVFTQKNSHLSFIVALLFAVHPMHTEVVANIKSLDELLHCLFFIACLYFLDHKKIIYQCLAYLFFLLALLAKESALLLLPVAMLYLMQICHVKWQQAFKKMLPLILVAVIWLVARTYIIQQSGALTAYTFEDNSLLACDGFFVKKITAIYMLALYVMKFFYPSKMSYDYSYNQIECMNIFSFEAFGSLLLLVALLFVAIKFYKKKPLLSFGILFFFIASALTNNLFLTIGTTMADRLMFTPYIGFFIAAAVLLTAVGETKPMNSGILKRSIAFILGIYLVSFSVKTLARNKDWQTNNALFEADLQHATNSARVNYNYGTVLLNSTNDYVLAQQYLERAYQINPSNTGIIANLGVVNYKNKNYKQAIVLLRKCIQLKPQDYYQMLNLADAFVKDNLFDSAIVYYRTALANNVYQPNTHNYYGTCLFNKQQFNDAEKIFADGLKIDGTNAELLVNYGNALAAQAKYNLAIEAFSKAIAINPSNKQAVYFLAMVYSRLGNVKQANLLLQSINK